MIDYRQIVKKPPPSYIIAHFNEKVNSNYAYIKKNQPHIPKKLPQLLPGELLEVNRYRVQSAASKKIPAPSSARITAATVRSRADFWQNTRSSGSVTFFSRLQYNRLIAAATVASTNITTPSNKTSIRSMSFGVIIFIPPPPTFLDLL